MKEEEKEDKADEEEEEEEEDVDFEGIDIFGIDEVDDIGGGMPLYKDFGMEDWALMSLCFELQLMAHAFKKDCNDPDRKAHRSGNYRGMAAGFVPQGLISWGTVLFFTKTFLPFQGSVRFLKVLKSLCAHKT